MPSYGSRPSAAPRDVPLERDPTHDPLAEVSCLRDDAVRAVRAHDEGRLDGRPADAGANTVSVDFDAIDGDAVAEVGSGRDRSLREVLIEAPALGHVDERPAGLAPERPPVSDPHDHALDHVLDDRADVARHVLERAARQSAPARLVAREAGLVHEENPCPRPGQVNRARGAGRAGSDDEDVEPLHAAIVV